MIWKWPIFVIGTRGENRHFSDAIYSIKHNINILLYNIPQIDVCLRFQNLKKNWKLVHKRRRYSHFLRCVFNKIHSYENCYFSDANYSIKHNIKVLLYGILQIDVCLRIQNLKRNEKFITNKGTRAISIRGVFNKNIVNFS